MLIKNPQLSPPGKTPSLSTIHPCSKPWNSACLWKIDNANNLRNLCEKIEFHVNLYIQNLTIFPSQTTNLIEFLKLMPDFSSDRITATYKEKNLTT